jgi:hypothetical protein
MLQAAKVMIKHKPISGTILLDHRWVGQWAQGLSRQTLLVAGGYRVSRIGPEAKVGD